MGQRPFCIFEINYYIIPRVSSHHLAPTFPHPSRTDSIYYNAPSNSATLSHLLKEKKGKKSQMQYHDDMQIPALYLLKSTAVPFIQNLNIKTTVSKFGLKSYRLSQITIEKIGTLWVIDRRVFLCYLRSQH